MYIGQEKFFTETSFCLSTEMLLFIIGLRGDEMMTYIKYSLILSLLYCAPLPAPHLKEMPFLNSIKNRKRITTGEFISGDNFRSVCDHIFDETHPWLDTEFIKEGDAIFVSGHYIDDFIGIYSTHIKHPYILITHNSDRSMPSGSTVNQDYLASPNLHYFLDDEKLFLWFAQNVDMAHPKLIHIPIGIENIHWGHNYVHSITEICNRQPGIPKNRLLSANFSVATNKPGRQCVYDWFKNKPFCFFPGQKNIRDYLIDVAQSKFILSPPGNGLDCHRTWEALYVGTIPIVQSSTLDPLFEDLPVAIVPKWADVTEEFLNKKYAEMTNTSYNLEKLYFPYWVNLIKVCQTRCRLG